MILRQVEPSAIDFAFARRERPRAKPAHGKTQWPDQLGNPLLSLSSQDAHERTPEGWIELIRGHWGGIENRNHWRRDALCGEDRTRRRKPRLVANLALLRKATLRLLSRRTPSNPCQKCRNASPTTIPARAHSSAQDRES